MAQTYGAGTTTQFNDGSQRQVLELGSQIHYYNPSVTPILTVSGRSNMRGTPVPIFEWMEDEYYVKRSTKLTAAEMTQNTDVVDSATGGVNGHQSIVLMPRQAQIELFEVGGLYTISGSGAQGSGGSGANTHFMCIAVGKDVNLSSPGDRHVQFVGGTLSGSTWTYDSVANNTDVITHNQITTFTWVGNISGTGSSSGKAAYEAGTDGASITDGETFAVRGVSGIAEGAAVGKETRKKVRRLKNCTQIFREPYEITRTARVSQQYGGPELARLQARKLAAIKVNVEHALLFNGAISLDATSSAPTRSFAGIGVGGTAGVIQTNNGDANTAYQLNNSSGTQANFDDVLEAVFQDMVDGSMHKTVYASNKWLTKMVKMVRDSSNSGAQLNAQMGTEAKAGLRVMEYMGPVGSVAFVPHPLLKGGYEDYAVAIDHANFDVRTLSESGFQLRRDIVKDGSDGQVDEWLVEMGPEIRQEQTHAILKLV